MLCRRREGLSPKNLDEFPGNLRFLAKLGMTIFHQALYLPPCKIGFKLKSVFLNSGVFKMQNHARENPKSRSRRILTTVLLGAIALFCSYWFYELGNFYSRLDDFSSAVKSKDTISARVAREHLLEFYEVVGYLKMRWLFDLLGNDRRYAASYLYLVGDYEGVGRELEGANDYIAFHLLGNAKFRFAKALYLSGHKKEGLDFAMREAAPEYERAVRVGPDSNFNDKWNYDLLTDEESAKKALENQSPSPKFKLGEDEPGGPDPGKLPENGSSFGNKKPGNSTNKKGKG
ncbi:MAG: hypothetical protein AAB897_03520 [Patescibacteria group bacterium]